VVLRFKQITGIILSTATFAALLFIPAETIDWPRAWIFLGVVFIGSALSTFSLTEDLLDERYKPPLQRGQPRADKLVVLALLATFFVAVLLIPLDVFRFHLMRPPGGVASFFGLVMFAAGWWLIAAAMIANDFAAPVVKHQAERGHHVIDGGPYRYVRHPMYAGVIPLLIGMALWLASYAAAIAAIVPMGLIAIRIVIEEKFLRRELPGYQEYITRTRYRLIPFIW
jgi:protein-S-isoprenylcysteine O-methyltransferase Ste14